VGAVVGGAEVPGRVVGGAVVGGLGAWVAGVVVGPALPHEPHSARRVSAGVHEPEMMRPAPLKEPPAASVGPNPVIAAFLLIVSMFHALEMEQDPKARSA